MSIQQSLDAAMVALTALGNDLVAFQVALGGFPAAAGRRGRPVALLPGTNGILIASKRRKKAPPQYCPVPGCKNKAAPVFGMVCGEHKDVAKSKIAKYRADRKAAKA